MLISLPQLIPMRPLQIQVNELPTRSVRDTSSCQPVLDLQVLHRKLNDVSVAPHGAANPIAVRLRLRVRIGPRCVTPSM